MADGQARRTSTEPLVGPEALSSCALPLPPSGTGGGADRRRGLQRGDSVKYTPPAPAMPKPQTKWLDKRVSGGNGSAGSGRQSLGPESSRPQCALPDFPSHSHHSWGSSAASLGGGAYGSGPPSQFYPRASRSGSGGWSRGDDRTRSSNSRCGQSHRCACRASRRRGAPQPCRMRIPALMCRCVSLSTAAAPRLTRLLTSAAFPRWLASPFPHPVCPVPTRPQR